jgi:hypothetical protein
MGLLAWVIGPTIIPHTSRFTPVAVPECRQAGEMTGSKECEVQPAGSKTKHAAECRTVVDLNKKGERG